MARTPLTLSVLCATRDPGPRVRAILEQVREVADEIVVLANAHDASAWDLAEYAPVADRLLRYEFAMPGERLSAWAHSECRGDWVLTLHGDEVLSPALVRRLPEVVRDAEVLQAWIPRRWLYPDAGHWLEEEPWYPDWQLRLVRNLPALLAFPGLTHTAASPLRPAVYLEEPMYHLDTLLQPLTHRRAKVEDYDADRPELSAIGGGPQNLYYLPEEWARSRPQPVPEEDVEAIRRVLVAAPRAAEPLPAEGLPMATRDVIDSRWAGRPLSDGAYAVNVEALEPAARLAPGEARQLSFRVTNLGDTSWPWGEQRPEIRMSYHLLDVDGRVLLHDGPRTQLPRAIHPGGTTVVLLQVAPIADPGEYVLDVDLVHEGVRWFGSSCRAGVTVGPRTPSSS